MSTPADVLAALLLTNRLLPLDVQPFTARELWELTERVPVGELLGTTAADVAELTRADAVQAERICALLDAATAFAFEQDRLADGGVALVSALDESFPARLRARLAHACPAFLLVAGPAEHLVRPVLGVVGAGVGDARPDLLAVATGATHVADRAGWAVAGGMETGVDRAALDAAAVAVGIPAEGILRVARNADVRRRVHAGELCLISPYGPNAASTAGLAAGRWKLIYALAEVTLVIVDDAETRAVAGAREAIDQRYGTVAVWTGTGRGPGAAALTGLGAASVDDVERVLQIEPPPPPPTQDALF